MASEERVAQLAAKKLERDRDSAGREGTTANDGRWQLADRLFAEALEVHEAERTAFLDRACGDDAELRALVEELLADDGALDSFLEEPLVPPTGLEELAGELAGDGRRIGPYRLMGQLGSGGMGTVYLAEQSEPVERKVALKLVKAGMDSEQVLARFEGERQALALMDHSNVARVYDAGATDLGRSYFAMEYVPGHEITEHCDQAGLGFRDRIRLFLQVCDGVQHAHQKGLIHRDLKPSNIMVKSSMDEPATVKIIDFGVAKSLQRKLSSHAAHTQLGTFVGTPIYSSPEQVLGRFVETDTRSDIYSLGVVLYELLVGTPPYSLEDFDHKTQHEIAQMLSEEPPSTPIERFTTSIGDAETVAQRRSLTVEQMQRRLRGDVSWILLKCLERRPDDRYSSVSELRKDLERWLEGLALEARPSTGLYRLQKLVRRHRTAVTVTVLVAAALLATTAAAVAGFLRAERAAEEAELAADFQVEQLREIDPAAMGIGLRTKLTDEIRRSLEERGGGPAGIGADLEKLQRLLAHANFTDLSLSLLDEHLFERAESAIEEKYAGAPLLQARLWQSVAETRRELGQYEGAVEPQERALELRRRELGPEHPLTLESLRHRGRLLMAMGRLEDAEADFRQALEASRRALGGQHPGSLYSISDLGRLFQDQGKLDEAEPYFREAEEARRRVLGDEHPETLGSINQLGSLLQDQGKLDEAEALYREALEGQRRVIGHEHPATLDSTNNLGVLLNAQGKHAEAESYLREALEIRRRVLGGEHPKTLISISNLGIFLRLRGKFDEAEPYYRETLEIRRRVLGDEHPDTLLSLNNLGGFSLAQGKLEKAEPYFREALDGYRRVLGDEHPATLRVINNLGGLLQDQGKLSEAEPYFREALEAYSRVLGDEHPDTLLSVNNVGVLLTAQGKPDEAEPYLRKAVEARRRVLGDQHPHTVKSVKNLASCLNERSQHGEAVQLMQQALPAAIKAMGEQHRLTAEAHSVLGEALAGVGDYEQAETHLLASYRIFEKALPPGQRSKLRNAAGRLVDLYEAWGKPTQAAEWRSK